MLSLQVPDITNRLMNRLILTGSFKFPYIQNLVLQIAEYFLKKSESAEIKRKKKKVLCSAEIPKIDKYTNI